MKKMKNCPFCNRAVNEEYPYVHFNDSLGTWIFSHYCKNPGRVLSVTIDIYGNSEQEVIDLWNGDCSEE